MMAGSDKLNDWMMTGSDKLSDGITLDNNHWCQTLVSSLHELQLSEQLCDVKITASDGGITWAHSCILAASSPAFASVLKTSQSQESPHSCYLAVTSQTVKNILQFIYTGKLTVSDTASLTPLFATACQLKLATLVEWCTRLGFQCDVPNSDLPGQGKGIVFGDGHGGMSATLRVDVAAKEECEDDDHEGTNNGCSPENSDARECSHPGEKGSVKIEICVKKRGAPPGRTRHGQRFTCSGCQKTFKQKRQYENHQASCEALGPINSREKEVSATKLQRGQSNPRKGERDYTCEVCGEHFSWAGSLWKHWKSHPDWMPYPCKVCSERFSTAKDLKHHRQLVHKGRFQCQQCDRVLTTVGKFTEHMKRHANAREYICCVCAARFNTKSQLTQHETLHLGLKPFKCDQCPKACGSQRHLDEHKLSHSSEKLYSCQYCGKRQKYMSGLRIHEKLHTQGRTCKCLTCGKTFATTSQLKQHSVTHTGEKRHKCSVCGQCFTGPSAKRRHEFAHTGLKPFPCSTCGKMFADKRDVREHEKIHASEKPEQCQQCGKCFHTSGGLNAHRKTHQTEERELYYCSSCNKSFMRSHNRNTHEVNVHGLPRRKRHIVPIIATTEKSVDNASTFLHQQQQQQQEEHNMESVGAGETEIRLTHEQLINIPLYATVATSQYEQTHEQIQSGCVL